MTLPRKEVLDANAVWSWLRRKLAMLSARRRTQQRVATAATRRLLVVCHGNICRSPLAAAMLEREMGAGVTVRSAGFHPVSGRPVPPAHLKLCREFDAHLEHHLSETVDKETAAWADAIVLMDSYNWLELTNMGVDPEKLIWLGSFDDGPIEIPDPNGLPKPGATLVARRIVACVRGLAAQLAWPAGRPP